MNSKLNLTLALATAGVLAISSQVASAAMSASDNAANYGGSWSTTPPNGGSGFGAWNIAVQNNNSPPYAGTYADTSSSVAVGGYSWGTYANSPQGTTYPRIDLNRPFTVNPTGYHDPSGVGTLYDQTFSVGMSSDGVGDGAGGPPDSFFGFSLQTGQGASATPVLTLEYSGTNANDSMVLTDNHGTYNSAVPITFSELHAGLLVSVSVGSNPDGLNPYTLTISPFAGGAPYTVITGDTTGPIQQVDLFDSNTTGNGYFNDLAITAEVPEPGTLALAGLGFAGALLFRRRQ